MRCDNGDNRMQTILNQDLNLKIIDHQTLI